LYFLGVGNLSSFFLLTSNTRVFLPTVLILITAIVAVAQSSQPGTAALPSNTPVTSGSTPTQSSSIQSNNPTSAASVTASTGVQVIPADDTPQVNPALRRIERARALAAAHQLPQAATDLENVRISVNDVALRNVTSLMLIGIYLEQGNYVRAQALLEESFQTRAAQKDESLRTYFAMAGQTINGIRAHLARYRSFGLNTSDTNLPVEANTDLERIRGVLDRVFAQAKEIGNEAGRSYDALALQEDVLGVRLSLARDNDDREKWQTQYVAVREKLASSQVQVASLGRSAALDAVTARIPNPFASKPNGQMDTGGNATPGTEVAKPTGATPPDSIGTSSATAEKSEPKLISTGSLSGRESKRVAPVYPSLARNTGVSGTVRVFAIIDENGKVWVTNSEGPSLLRKAAEDAARGWSFPPTLVSGKPVRVAGYLDFDFKL
jgi:TonB family protein